MSATPSRIVPGGTLELFSLVAQREHGIDPTTIEQVNSAAPGPEDMQSLEGGAPDSFAALEPFNATAAVEGWATGRPRAELGGQ